MKKINQIKVIIALLSISICVFMLSGCSDSTQTISNHDLIENARGADEEVAKQNKEKLKGLFDRQYANKLYLEDFSEVEEALNEAYIEQFEKEIFDGFNFPYFISSEVEFYNDSLKKLRDGQISVQDILLSPEEHLREFSTTFFVFATNEERPHEAMHALDEKLIAMNELYNAHDIKHRIEWRIYDSEVLKDYKIQDIEAMENPRIFLEQEGVILDETYYTDSFVSNYEDDTKMLYKKQTEVITILQKKYGLDFVPLGQDQYMKDMYAPVNELDLRFEELGHKDRFLTIRAQKVFSDKIYEIIEEENASGYIGALVVPNDSGNTNINRKSYDLSQPVDDIVFLSDVYEPEYDVSLVYLATNEEEIDYEKMLNITRKIWMLFDNQVGFNKSRIAFFIDLYIVNDESEKELITSLLYENRLSERYMSWERGLENIYINMYKRRLENEAYFYLDIYATKLEYFMSVPSNTDLEDVEKFKKLNTRTSEFR